MAVPTCSICMHNDLASIDEVLAAGSKLIPTASNFGVSKSALGRHRANCLGPRMRAAAKILQPVHETRAPVERAKAIIDGQLPRAEEVLALTGLLERLARSLDRLESAADSAAADNMHSSLAAVSGQLHRGVEAAAKLQGMYVEPDAQPRSKFSISIVFPTSNKSGDTLSL